MRGVFVTNSNWKRTNHWNGATRILHTIAPTVVVVVVWAAIKLIYLAPICALAHSTSLWTIYDTQQPNLSHSLAPSFFYFLSIHKSTSTRSVDFFECGFSWIALNLIPTPLRLWWFWGSIERDGERGDRAEHEFNAIDLFLCSVVVLVCRKWYY